MTNLAVSINSDVGPLTPREGQVVGLIDGGMTSKEVAFELGLADATVRVLFARARRKLGRPRRRRFTVAERGAP